MEKPTTKYSLIMVPLMGGKLDPDRPESLLCGVYWDKVEKQGLIPYAFPGGDIVDKSSWFSAVCSSLTMVGLVLDSNPWDPIAHILLNSFHGYSAMIHFSVCREYHGRESICVGNDTLNNLAGIRRADGTPYVETLIGLTPKTNRAAIWYIRKLGFEDVIIVPHAYKMAYDGNRYDDALMTILDLQNWEMDNGSGST